MNCQYCQSSQVDYVASFPYCSSCGVFIEQAGVEIYPQEAQALQMLRIVLIAVLFLLCLVVATFL